MENNNIIFLYDAKLAGVPRTNINFKRSGVSRFYKCNIESRKTPYKVFTVEEYVKYNDYSVPVIYVIELIWKDIDSLFKYVDIDAMNYIIKRRIPLLIYFPTEGFSFNTANWVNVLKDKFKQHNLEKNLKYLITGNLLNDPLEIFNKTYALNYFEYELSHNVGIVQEYNSVESKKPYDFLSYNANPRPGRTALASEILRHNLNENALFSWIGNPDWSFESTKHETFKLLPQKGQKYYKKILKRGFSPYILDVDNQEKSGVINTINVEHYDNSYFSLISETETDNHCRFITEKTYKPIYAGHPFIIYGSPGILKYLRSIGYQTFPTLFDESYDNEQDPVERMQLIIKEVQKFKRLNSNEKLEIIKSQNNIVKHNYENLLKRWNTVMFNDLDNILGDIANDIKENKSRL